MAGGDHEAADRLLPLVYDQLRPLARSMLNHESPGNTLQLTALLQKTYLRMADQTYLDWRRKTHFFAIGAEMDAFWSITIAAKKGMKRGGDTPRIPLDHELCVTSRSDEDVLAAEDALMKVAEIGPHQTQLLSELEQRHCAGKWTQADSKK